MRRRATLCTGLMLLIVAVFFLPTPAHAYLDPGTGSYFIQIALAALVGAAFAVRLFWGRIKAFFQKLFSRGAVEEGQEVEGALEDENAE